MQFLVRSVANRIIDNVVQKENFPYTPFKYCTRANKEWKECRTDQFGMYVFEADGNDIPVYVSAMTDYKPGEKYTVLDPRAILPIIQPGYFSGFPNIFKSYDYGTIAGTVGNNGYIIDIMEIFKTFHCYFDIEDYAIFNTNYAKTYLEISSESTGQIFYKGISKYHYVTVGFKYYAYGLEENASMIKVKCVPDPMIGKETVDIIDLQRHRGLVEVKIDTSNVSKTLLMIDRSLFGLTAQTETTEGQLYSEQEINGENELEISAPSKGMLKIKDTNGNLLVSEELQEQMELVLDAMANTPFDRSGIVRGKVLYLSGLPAYKIKIQINGDIVETDSEGIFRYEVEEFPAVLTIPGSASRNLYIYNDPAQFPVIYLSFVESAASKTNIRIHSEDIGTRAKSRKKYMYQILCAKTYLKKKGLIGRDFVTYNRNDIPISEWGEMLEAVRSFVLNRKWMSTDLPMIYNLFRIKPQTASKLIQVEGQNEYYVLFSKDKPSNMDGVPVLETEEYKAAYQKVLNKYLEWKSEQIQKIDMNWTVADRKARTLAKAVASYGYEHPEDLVLFSEIAQFPESLRPFLFMKANMQKLLELSVEKKTKVSIRSINEMIDACVISHDIYDKIPLTDAHMETIQKEIVSGDVQKRLMMLTMEEKITAAAIQKIASKIRSFSSQSEEERDKLLKYLVYIGATSINSPVVNVDTSNDGKSFMKYNPISILLDMKRYMINDQDNDWERLKKIQFLMFNDTVQTIGIYHMRYEIQLDYKITEYISGNFYSLYDAYKYMKNDIKNFFKFKDIDLIAYIENDPIKEKIGTDYNNINNLVKKFDAEIVLAEKEYKENKHKDMLQCLDYMANAIDATLGYPCVMKEGASEKQQVMNVAASAKNIWLKEH